VSYERFLEWAEGTDRLIPLKALRSFPGDPNLTLVAYGQGRSAVKYMIDTFGEVKMAQLLSTLGTGIGISDSLEAVYGFDIDGLENRWREHIGAEPYVEATPGPTPTAAAEPTPTYKLLTSPPESSSANSDTGDDTEPTEQPEATVEPLDVGDDVEFEDSEAGENSSEESDEETASGTCSAPSAGSVDGTSGAWLLIVVGLAAGGRYRSRKGHA